MSKSQSPIAQWRKAQEPRVSQPDFGSKLKPPVDASTVSRWEAGGVPLERIAEVARLINAPLCIFIPGHDYSGNRRCEK